jgi:DNA-binding winged helix-turn-helix (wHTH) protein/TolB-like protein/tetratricopeptide (TPR) repeat protein
MTPHDDSPMNPGSDASTIDLAREPPFRLGELLVRPAALELVAADQSETLERRVMQVLVALARRRGEVVSRDELIQACWGGRVVGDDAINRCVGRLRKLAAAHGGFSIETVPRVGVRLAERPESHIVRAVRRFGLWAVAAAAIVLAVAGFWAWRDSRVTDAASPRIVISGFEALGDDPAARAFAAALTDEVRGVLGEKAVGFAILEAADASAASSDLILHGTVVRQGDVWRVRTYLEHRRSKLNVWSRQFERPAGEEATLRDEVAVAVTDVTYTAMLPFAEEGLELDPQTLALFIAATWEFSNPRDLADPRIRRLFEQVAARAPDFVWVRGALSRNFLDASRGAAPKEQEELRRRALAEAERAIRMDPRAAAFAYDTLYMHARITAPHDLAIAEDHLLKGISASPESPWLYMRECRLLLEVGRAADALRYCEQARALRPLHGVIDASYASALYHTGQLSLATQAAEQSARFHPEHPLSRLTLRGMVVFHGDPARARVLFWGPAKAPTKSNGVVGHAWDLFIRARETGAAADADRAIAAMWSAFRAGGVDAAAVGLAAADLGRLDDASRALELYGPAPPPKVAGLASGALLEPAAAPLRRDPRFWPLAAKAGYVRYWQKRNRWPDFCSDPDLPFDCRKEAARVSSAAG